MSALYISGVVLSFFLCLLLAGKKGKTGADYILAVWLCWVGFHVFFFYLYQTENIFDYPYLLGISLPMPMAHPVFLYLYTAALCRGHLPRYWFAHLAPITAAYFYLVPFFLSPAEEKVLIFRNKGVGYETFMFLINLAIYVSGIVYTLLAYRLLQRHRRLIADLFSYEENINLQWLQYLIYWLAFIWLIVFTGIDVLVFLAAVLFVMFIGYFGIRQTGIFSGDPATRQLVDSAYADPDPDIFETLASGKSDTDENEEADRPSSADRKKYEKSGLNEEAGEDLHRRLQELMDNSRMYRESELSLTDLAERLGTHPNYLSQIINEKEGRNFYDYVNSKRIEAFLDMAQKPESQRFTLLALALECGFNSKSAFNRYFKKAMGKSPSEYLGKSEPE